MTSTMQTPMDRTGRRASRAFAPRHLDSVGIGLESRGLVRESA